MLFQVYYMGVSQQQVVVGSQQVTTDDRGSQSFIFIDGTAACMGLH